MKLPSGASIDGAAIGALDHVRDLARGQRLEAVGTALVRNDGTVHWYTYSGLRANRAIADVLASKAGRTATSTNTTIRIVDESFNLGAFLEELRSLSESSHLESALEERPAPKVGVEVKFVDLLPQSQYERFARERIYDTTSALKVLNEPVRFTAT